MQKIKTGYIYFFCALHNTFKKLKGQIFAPDFQAVSVMMVLEGIFVCSLPIYYDTFTKGKLLDGNPINTPTLLLVVIIALLQYFVFYRKDRWKGYIVRFEALPKQLRTRYSIIAWLIVILIFANLIVAFYLMSLIDWKKYR